MRDALAPAGGKVKVGGVAGAERADKETHAFPRPRERRYNRIVSAWADKGRAPAWAGAVTRLPGGRQARARGFGPRAGERRRRRMAEAMASAKAPGQTVSPTPRRGATRALQGP